MVHVAETGALNRDYRNLESVANFYIRHRIARVFSGQCFMRLRPVHVYAVCVSAVSV